MTPTDVEKKNLEMHVELSALREEQLWGEIEANTKDINTLKEIDNDLYSRLEDIIRTRNSQIIRWGGAIILALIGALGTLIIRVLIPLFMSK